MITQATALVLDQPGAALRLERRDLPTLQPGQIQVKMQAAPINPADLNMLEGAYPIALARPGVPGCEGVGVVTRTGVAVAELKVGQQVIFPSRVGAWCDSLVCEAREAFPIPPGLPVEQAAMAAVNPATALRLLLDFVPLKPGDWLIQNAANSGVGRQVIRLARARQLRTVNLVRRPEQVAELETWGGDVVLVQDDTLAEQIRARTGGAALTLGLNAVGGAALRGLVRALAPGATLVTYGAMAREPFTLGNGDLIFRDLRPRGFWVTAWYRRANAREIQSMFAELLPLIRNGTLATPVERSYALHEFAEALAHAARPQRSGKILFRMG